jgi:hypothetical protein
MVCPYNDGYGLSISESNKFPLKEKLGSPSFTGEALRGAKSRFSSMG